MKKVIFVTLACLGVYYFYQQGNLGETSAGTDTDTSIAQPAENWRSGQQIRSQGTVIRILSDDNEGSRHQRFIVQHASGRTLLIAHNIDVAPRVGSLRNGDTVAFYGQYESNDKGGVIHWTHHDPQGRHTDGWLEHIGQRYQ
jgi:hypothetical protein